MPNSDRANAAGAARAPAPATTYEGPEHSPGFLLWRATLQWQRAVRDALAPHELTHVQFVMLASAWWLQEHGRSSTQREIAQHAAADQMMASQVLRRLEAKELVARAPDPADTRAMIVTLTDAGRRRLAGALPAVEAADEAFFSGLGRGREAFVAGLTRLSWTDDR